MINVAIIGLGFVGKAMHELFKQYDGQGYVVNPYSLSEYNSQEEKDKAAVSNIAFICVGTPMKADKTCDLSQIYSVMEWVKSPIVVIKSTTPVGTVAKLQEKYPNTKFVHNPEFLTEKNAVSDVINATRTVLGGPKDAVTEVCRLYQKVYDANMVYYLTDSNTSEMIKYTINSFLAVKVAYFNQIYDICNALGLSYEEVREGVLFEPRITRSHTTITDVRGFGGHCLPKDLNALIETTDGKCDVEFLKDIWDYNCKIRKEFNGKQYD